ncbi:hypothetical protein, partial [uncultured Anaerolinea sp.]|uniref:hypothetical protein n=1 Tax=uncultured Anaerolinea sp. TaxID=430695 RepID=UPI002630323C
MALGCSAEKARHVAVDLAHAGKQALHAHKPEGGRELADVVERSADGVTGGALPAEELFSGGQRIGEIRILVPGRGLEVALGEHRDIVLEHAVGKEVADDEIRPASGLADVLDLERVAPAMPGAEVLEKQDDDHYKV